MAGLGDTVAGLLARGRGAAAVPGAGAGANLRPVLAFGSNPGSLRMWLHVPEALPSDAPLVVVLHGCSQSAAGYAAAAGWLELADQYGFAVLCPEQVRTNNANLCFNWFEDADTRRGSGEAASIEQMIRRAIADIKLDARRVFVTGLSAGGAMAAAMLAAYPELFAAGAVIAGLPVAAASGMNQALAVMRRIPDRSAKDWGDRGRGAAPPPERWPAISIWHGEADATVTPAAARALALQWCDVHGATRSVAGPSADSRHTHDSWVRPDGAACVALHRIAGLGHGTPISTQGEDACGSPAPWVLDAGLSSSHEIARSWGILGVRRRRLARPEARSEGHDEAEPRKTTRSRTADVGETIARALRDAGLMR